LSGADQKLSSPRRTNWFKQSSLRRSFSPGKCLVCSNLIATERRAIRSFLYEGMMSPEPRAIFLRSGGFCLRHFWIAKRIEEECWPTGGIGVAILCENLLDEFSSASLFAGQKGRRSRSSRFSRRKESEMRLPSFACTFCRDNREREHALLEELEDLVTKGEWSKLLTDAPFCLGHSWLALRFWQGDEARAWIEKYFRTRRDQLAADVKEYIRKRDRQYRDEPPGSEQGAVPHAIEFLVGLVDQFPDTDRHEPARFEGGSEACRSAEMKGGKRHAG
jgi:hypothetical protein